MVGLTSKGESVPLGATVLDEFSTVNEKLTASLRKHACSILRSGVASSKNLARKPRTVLYHLGGKGIEGLAGIIQDSGTAVGVLAMGATRGYPLAARSRASLASAAKVLSRIVHDSRVRYRQDQTHQVLTRSLQILRQNYGQLLEDRTRELEKKNVVLSQEIGERWRIENGLRLLVDVTAAASEARDVRGMLQACLDKICHLVDWPVGQAWLLDASSNELVCEPDVWCSRLNASRFRQASLGLRLSRGIGLLGRVWETGKPIFVRNTPTDESSPRAEAALAAGLEGHFGLPLMAGSRFLGVLEFLSLQPTPPDERFMEAASRLGNHLSIVFERLRHEADLRQQRAFTDRMILSSQEGIFAFDRDCCFTIWNPALQQMFGISAEEALGRPAFDVLPFLRETGEGKFFHAALEGASGGGQDRIYSVRGGEREGFFDSYYSPIWEDHAAAGGRVIGGFAIIHDVTAHKRSQDAMKNLSNRLLRLQEEERRRIARELHDGPAQTVSAISMYLAKLQQNATDLGLVASTALAHSIDLTQQSVREIRSLSYLLYPPELGSLGFAAGLRMYAEGFTRRTGVDVEVNIPARASELSEEATLALFRVAQQCLSNVHRHAKARQATISLTFAEDELQFEVADDGRGFPAAVLEAAERGSSATGVGVSGMRDRVGQLGGELKIQSNSRGSQVTAVIPLRNGTWQAEGNRQKAVEGGGK
jgi:PAS domain S-box-containing protein